MSVRLKSTRQSFHSVREQCHLEDGNSYACEERAVGKTTPKPFCLHIPASGMLMHENSKCKWQVAAVIENLNHFFCRKWWQRIYIFNSRKHVIFLGWEAAVMSDVRAPSSVHMQPFQGGKTTFKWHFCRLNIKCHVSLLICPTLRLFDMNVRLQRNEQRPGGRAPRGNLGRKLHSVSPPVA